MHHFIQRGGYQTTQSYHVYLFLYGMLYNGFGRHHDAKVHYIVPVAGHYYRDYIFANVVHITFHRSQQYLPGSSRTFFFLRLDYGLEDGNRFLHGACRLHYLRQEHFACPKQIAYMIHARHQRTFNDRNSFGIQLQRFGKVFFQIIADTLCQGVLQPLFHRSPLSPGKLGMGGSLPLSSRSFCRLCFRFQAFGSFYQALGSIGTTVQDHILYALQYISGNIGVKNGGSRIDDTHIHALADGIVKEYGMHRLANVIIAAEREGKVTHSSTDMRTGQILAYPSGGTDKVYSIIVVLVHTSCHGKYIRVENYIMGIETYLVHQKTVCPFADLNLTFVRVCLPFFIKSHHHGRRTILLYGTRMFQEFIFPLLQGDGVDDGLALQAFQSGHNHFPLRGVYHDGNTGNLRFRSYQMEESRHLHLSVQQPVVHIYIDDLRTVFHLLAGNAERLVIFLFINQTQEFARTRNITAFTHIHEVIFRLHFQKFKPGEPKIFRSGTRLMGRCTGNQRGVLGNVGICRSATTTDNIHQSLMDILFYFMCHIGRSLVVCAQTVGQSGVGISTDIIRCTGSKLLQERFQLAGAKGAVQPN